MDFYDKYFFIIRTVENPNPPPFRQAALGPPKKIVFQFLIAGFLEAENRAPLGIHAGHDVLDGAVLARRVHGLENKKQYVDVGGIQQFLQGTQLGYSLFVDLHEIAYRIVKWLDAGRPRAQIHLGSRNYLIFARPDIYAFFSPFRRDGSDPASPSFPGSIPCSARASSVRGTAWGEG